MKLSEIWFEQCQAAREIELEFGVPDALDYLIGERFLSFVEAAGTDSDFREELPDFIAEIKTIFEPWQIAEYLDKVRLTGPFSAGPDEDEEDDDEVPSAAPVRVASVAPKPAAVAPVAAAAAVGGDAAAKKKIVRKA